MGQTSSTVCMSSTTSSASSSSDPDSADDSPQSSAPSSSQPVVRPRRRSLLTIQSDTSETSDDDSGDSSPHRISFSSDEESNAERDQQYPVPRSLSGSNNRSSSSSSVSSSSSDSDNESLVTMPSSNGEDSQGRTSRARRAPRRLVAAVDESVPGPPTVNPPTSRSRGRPRRQTAQTATTTSSATVASTTAMASSAPLNPVVLIPSNPGIGMMQRLLFAASSVINHQTSTSATPAVRAIPSTDPAVRAIPSTDPAVRAIPSTDPAANVAAPPNPPRIATTSSAAVSAGNFNAAVSYFECVVCLENLDSPATILEPVPRTAGVQNQEVVIHMDNHGIVRQNPGAAPVEVQVQSSSPIARRRTAAEKRETALAEVDPREICATSCGHMYHKYCIQKWFNEQGRKTCPSCRKNVGTKMIRLFPNVAQDAPTPAQVATGLSEADAAGTTGGSGGVAIGAPRRVPRSGCGNVACTDLVTIHGTLVSDYNTLRELYVKTRDDLEVRKGEIASLQDGYDSRGRELDDLKASAAAANEHAPKRPRRR